MYGGQPIWTLNTAGGNGTTVRGLDSSQLPTYYHKIGPFLTQIRPNLQSGDNLVVFQVNGELTTDRWYGKTVLSEAVRVRDGL